MPNQNISRIFQSKKEGILLEPSRRGSEDEVRERICSDKVTIFINQNNIQGIGNVLTSFLPTWQQLKEQV